jgi:hypothetical protein
MANQVADYLKSNVPAQAAQKKLTASTWIAIGGGLAAGLSAALPSVAAILPMSVLGVVNMVIAVLNIFTKSNITAGVTSAWLAPSPLEKE